MSATIIGLDRHYGAIIGCAAAFTAASVITLAMRVASKVLTRAPFGFEDWTIILGTAFYVVTEALMMKGVAVGRFSNALNDPPDMVLTKMVYIYSIFYFTIMALSIASILLLYRRLFVKPFMKHSTTILLIITFGWWVPCTWIQTGYGNTLPETFAGNPEETTFIRVNYLLWWLIVGLIEQVIIVIAIFLPIREVYRLHLNLQKRIFLAAVFAISYICVGTGIARLATIYHPDAKNLDISIGDIWVSVHLGTALMSANLPLCWPVVVRTKSAIARTLSVSHDDSEKFGPGRFLNGSRHRGDHSSSQAVSDIECVLESATLGPTTKDGNFRHDTMAEDMQGATNRERNASKGHHRQKVPHRLQLRSFDCRISGSIFSNAERNIKD